MVPKETQSEESHSNAPQSDFGRYLQVCRLESGHSLDDIAQQTKINRSCLQQIENEELRKLPQSVFVKGFLRTYANAVGGDAEEVLRRYNNRCGILEKNERDVGMASSRTRYWARFLIILILFSVAVFVTLYAVGIVKSADTRRLPADVDDGLNAQTEPAATVPPKYASASVPPKDAPASVLPKDTLVSVPSKDTLVSVPPKDTLVSVPPKDTLVSAHLRDASVSGGHEDTSATGAQAKRFNLRVSAVARTRLKIISDAGLPQQFELQVGEKIAVSANKHFNLLINNATGVRLTLNDKPVVISGKRDQVVTLNLP